MLHNEPRFFSFFSGVGPITTGSYDVEDHRPIMVCVIHF